MNGVRGTSEVASGSEAIRGEPPLPGKARSRIASTLWGTVQVLYVRLRFLLLIAVGGLVIGRWEDLRAWTDRALDRLVGSPLAPKTISPDTEFFCPMCPGVVTRWPEKCPVCKMPLVRRKSGGSGTLPYGVVSRMQFSPYRVQLAGVRTIPVSYRPLAAELIAIGRFTDATTDSRTAEVQVSGLDASLVRVGQQAVLKIAGGAKTQTWQATVAQLPDGPGGSTNATKRVTLKAADSQPWPEVNTPCVAQIAAPLALREPFASMPHDPPPISPSDPRTVYSCPDHIEYLFLKSGKCPFDENELVAKPLGRDERVHWSCPAHPDRTALVSGESCADCGGHTLQPHVVTFWPAGEVLAVPETAVVEAGQTALVFVESGPGMFDGRVVELGPAAEGYVSIVRGVAADERVVATSTFLLDAETRLNPGVVSAYFGATPTASGSSAVPSTSLSRANSTELKLDRFNLTRRDRALAEQQRICPVTRLPLGSMGTPIPIVLPDQTFFLCCEGCRSKLPQRTQQASAASGHQP